ncbi:hypothetical protein Ade02nite_75180 [Paractinoplanes deccanensis]|uniref:Uncharacterized protein n=1 Tax=Paractinoplanes deccanensis TaxID=113561 RepID=A0ABQ3YFV6_9ACTN|nr:hypothetical protein [Actinoplanes deccanensis]GID78877.1 hypothetical protein Ade02nite_75180 [Actinoplanes deccanensis]
MYAWIWRKLPFGFWGKLTGSLGLIAATTALLWYVVFPWATPLLPFDDVQVGTGTEQQGPDGNVVDPSSEDEAPDEIPYSTESNAPHPSDAATTGSNQIPGD